MASGEASAARYAPAYWAGSARGESGARQYTIRLAAPSEAAFHDTLDRLRWEAEIDTLWCGWDDGEGAARVECCGGVATVLDALGAIVQSGALLAIHRA